MQSFTSLRIVLVFRDNDGLLRALLRRCLLGYEALGRTRNGRVDADCSFAARREWGVVDIVAAAAVVVAVLGVGARVVCWNRVARKVSSNAS